MNNKPNQDIFWPRPAVLDQIGPHGHVVIQASAGTGKTYTIEHLMVDLVLQGTPIEEILTVTFTEKATLEIRTRVRALLEKMCDATCPPHSSEESNAPPPETPSSSWRIDAVARARLQTALFSFDSASISTIHGFCQNVLREFAFLHGGRFDEHIRNEVGLIHDAFHVCLRGPFLSDPSAVRALERQCLKYGIQGVQDLVVQTLKSDLDILMDPRTLARDAYTAVSQAFALLPPAMFEANPAASEPFEDVIRVVHRIDSTDEDATQLILGTLHDFCTANPKYAARLRVEYKAAFERLSPVFDRIVAYALPLAQDILPLARLVRSELITLKRSRDELDFSDIVRRVADALTREATVFDSQLDAEDPARFAASTTGRSGRRTKVRPDPSQQSLMDLAVRMPRRAKRPLRNALRDRYRHALIDEFQDTDDIQWGIFKAIFVEDPPKPPARIFVVGDPKQAIYGWRGADVTAYLRATRELAATGTSVVLRENYRSSASFLGAINEILDDAPASRLLSGEVRYDSPVCAAGPSRALEREDGGALSPVVLLSIATKVNAAVAKSSIAAEMASELRSILGLDNPQTRLWIRQGQTRTPVEAKDIFVLTRTGNEASEISTALRQASVPHVLLGERNLFQTDEARGLDDLLAGICDPGDRSKRLRAVLTIFFDVPLDRLVRAQDLPADDPRVTLLRRWNELGRNGRWAPLFAEILERTGVVAREIFFGKDDRALVNLLHLIEILQKQVRSGSPSLDELSARFHRWVEGSDQPEDKDELQRTTADRDAVQILTMHASKGLEAPIVMLYGGLYTKPSDGEVHVARVGSEQLASERVGLLGTLDEAPTAIRMAINKQKREDDERLLYVALTRAKVRCYLPYLTTMAKTPNGSYAPLLGRLVTLLTKRVPRSDETHLPFFEFRQIIPTTERTRRAATEANKAELAPLSTWNVEEIFSPGDESQRADVARPSARPLIVTSYTKLHRQDEVLEGHSSRHDKPREADRYDSTGMSVDELDLPGGRTTGIFLHALLEQVPLDSFEPFTQPVSGELDSKRWLARPEIAEIFDATMLRHRILPHFRQRAADMVFRAWHTAMPVGFGEPTIALHRCRIQREVDFEIPIPPWVETEQDVILAPPFRIDHGSIVGSLDVLAEMKLTNGDLRYFFADWKSDVLEPNVDPQTHISTRYDLQQKLYALAMVHLLGEERFSTCFGGALYLLLRTGTLIVDNPSLDDIRVFASNLGRRLAPARLL